ncbi:MAG: hypothetical protein IPJ87_09700 [Flavobacteriales bacterium]|jgi:hypothetical protein|nr:hypothetical protein [Flavobacteriales bacterium]MBK7942126.1 hypothetical protein [Flavobacteriales bacterium]MBK8949602.1 hypothetical protein [Flavobacteriales bacterium]MBK9700667.1 hypothetical protein [Flavobacteriales bacterium]
MDADQRLTDDAVDGRLRALFHTAGPMAAPDDLEDRVLMRLKASASGTAVMDKPLLSRTAWVSAAVMLLVLWGWTSMISAPDMPSTTVPILPMLGWDTVLSALTAPWTLMALTCGALLVLLDAILSRPRPAPRTA